MDTDVSQLPPRASVCVAWAKLALDVAAASRATRVARLEDGLRRVVLGGTRGTGGREGQGRRVEVRWLRRNLRGRWIRSPGRPITVGSGQASFALDTQPDASGSGIRLHSDEATASVVCWAGDAACVVGASGDDAATVAAATATIGLHVIQAVTLRPTPQVRASHRRVLDLLLKGLSEPAIAEQLDMTEAAVHGRVRRIYKSHAVTSRPMLLAHYLKQSDS